ncbi:sterol-sensing domain containing protein [Nitzschia inconspicua]|uniref:Sterol-sensing domain containing protein n=1 Tax=Nitzschia inconspicua TaxID=303405 RepID=A0A9K3KWR5_9STRA|nr:sterol-sensing domain containing protein [Nitzschia inconspicua]
MTTEKTTRNTTDHQEDAASEKKDRSVRSHSPSKKFSKQSVAEESELQLSSTNIDQSSSSTSSINKKGVAFNKECPCITDDALGDTSFSSSRGQNDSDELQDDKVPPQSFWQSWDVTPAEDALFMNNFFERESKRVARCPCTYLWVALIISVALSAIAMIVGEFEVSAETGGWQSRGTLIANRHTQTMLATEFRAALFYGGEDAWNELVNNVQPGWDTGDDDNSERRLSTGTVYPSASIVDAIIPKRTSIEQNSHEDGRLIGERVPPFFLTPDLQRRLQDTSETEPALAGCDFSLYDPFNITKESRLWPAWKVGDPSKSALDAEVLRDLCVAEQNTQRFLEENGLCFGCESGCLPPYSLVFFARLVVVGGFSMGCDELSAAWEPFQLTTETSWKECVQIIKSTYDPNNQALPDDCPFGFSPTFIQENFDETLITSYTSTIFMTSPEDLDELYANMHVYDRGNGAIEGAFDTQYEDFVDMYIDTSIGRDMSLAVGSAVIVSMAIIIHTRSPLITGVGLLQIILSFPLSFFVYKLVAGLVFFPFLNFIGIFVVFALGAGDVFVAIDKWKNARIAFPIHTYSTEYIAAKALPDAAYAMFLTTFTTAVAFFATAICPVAPIKMFAIFCGLLILFDYIMNVLLVFPALCIYDKAMIAREKHGPSSGFCGRCWSCCVSCSCFGMCGPNKRQLDDLEDAMVGDHAVTASKFIRTQSRALELAQEDEQEAITNASFIQRMMLSFYSVLHKLPTSSDVRLLNSDHEYEKSFTWRQQLLSEQLEKLSGSRAYIIWGVVPADTGDRNTPASWSQLVLDETFDPSPEDAQTFLRQFCVDLFAADFASEIDNVFVCPLTRFDEWLTEQAASDTPDDGYVQHCGSASSIPVPQANFHPCISHWAATVDETSILSRNEIVQIMFLPYNSRVRYDSFFDILKAEWELIEDWMAAMNTVAPSSVNKGFSTSFDFWWFDTNGQMLNTAFSAAAIALSASAAIILLSSRSIFLTFFSTLTIGFVLTSVTSVLVGIGWTLGFLESICFAILIGVSVDFVIHLAHAYTHKSGEISRGDRTKYALVKMGPSILATAVTTILSAVIMLFTIITFFQKFALILFFTIIMATVGSFVFLLTFLDCIGPSNPTFLVDKCVAMFNGTQTSSVTGTEPPSRFDIVIGKESHPGTKSFRIIVRAYIRNQRNGDQSKPLPPFSPMVSNAILSELADEHKIVKGPAPRFLIIDPTELEGEDETFRLATQNEKTEFIRACYVEQL